MSISFMFTLLRIFLAEWVARRGIQWAFTCKEPLGEGAAWFSAFLFSGSHRGTLLSIYSLLKKGRLDEAISRVRGYYAASRQRAGWGKRLEQWRFGINRSENSFIRKQLPRLFSLANTWQRSQPLPCQVQNALWKTKQYDVLAELAAASGQIVLQAHALFAGGTPEAALEQLKKIPREKWNGEAIYVCAKCLQALGNHSEALTMLEEAVFEIGAGMQTHQLLVELYRQVGREADASRVERVLKSKFMTIRGELKLPPDGKVYHIITEDHELTKTPGKSETHPWFSIKEARVQLIEKGRMVNRIALNCGTPWTHLIDIGSYTVLKAAAEKFPATWGGILSEFEAFLTETIATGSDLGVHVHPDKSWLVIDKIESDRVYFNPSVLGWGNLGRFGNAENPSSKVGFLAEGRKLVERCGKLADPGFQPRFFRSGSYNMGSTLFEVSESVSALCYVGLNVGSDALEMDGITESLGRDGRAIYNAAWESIWDEDHKSNFLQMLPLRAEFMPVYSVVDAARLYQKDSMLIAKVGKKAKGLNVLVSMDHDIEIGNAKSGGRWDDLDPNSEDWKALSNYLTAIGNSNHFQCVRARDVVGLC